MNISIELLKNYKIFKNINNEDLKKFLSIISPATKAANTPSITSKKVATKLCNVFLAISLKVLSANLHPTEAPSINKQKSIIFAGSL